MSGDKLWTVTMLSPLPGEVAPLEPITLWAELCEVVDGALVFRGGGGNLSVKVIIAAGLWMMAEKEMEGNRHGRR